MAPSQCLLKRRPSTDRAQFRESYERHGRLVLPWCLANNVVQYSQIHSPRWASPEAKRKYSDVVIEEHDAAAEMVFMDAASPQLSGPYYENVILTDERRFLYSEATKHMVVVDAGSVVGDRVVFIADGRPTVAFEEWADLWEETKGARVPR